MPENAYLLLPFDEATEVQCQEHCEREMEDVLTEIFGLVAIAEMPVGTRIHLIDGLHHIRRHIAAQTCALTSDISGRVN